MNPTKHKAIHVYLAVRFFSALFFAVIVTVNLVYQATIVGLNPLQLVLVGTLLEAVSFVFEVPTGIVADIYSRKLSIMIGLLLIGLGFTVEGLFPFFAAVLIAQVIWGIGFTFVSGAREAWIADEIGEDKAGMAFSKGAQISLFGSLIGIAMSILLANINIRLPIILGGILYSMQSVYVLFFMPEDNFHPTPVTKRETFKAMKNTLIQGINLIKLSPVLLIIVSTGLIFGMFSEGFDRLWTPFMLDTFDFPGIFNLKSVTWFGVLAMVANILSILVIRFAEKKTDTNNHRSTVTALFVVNGLLVASLVFFGLTTSFMVAAVGYWLVAMFREARNPLYDAWVNQNVESKVRATVFSMCGQANSIGQIVGGPILGLIATMVSLRLSIVLSGFILIPTLFLYILSFKKHKLPDPALP
jgi:MFS transporter, DHA3 family, tetracycline resistance protein